MLTRVGDVRGTADAKIEARAVYWGLEGKPSSAAASRASKLEPEIRMRPSQQNAEAFVIQHSMKQKGPRV